MTTMGMYDHTALPQGTAPDEKLYGGLVTDAAVDDGTLNAGSSPGKPE